MSPRFFEGNFPSLQEELHRHFDRMRDAWKQVEGKAVALVLGGGYGRGEGGVCLSKEGGRLFNDLDYFLFSESPEDEGLASWCLQWEREETDRLGVDVEIKRLPPDHVSRGKGTMMFADLIGGHFKVAGDASFLAALAESQDFSKVGAEDASRLLWNRGSGLLFSRARGANDAVFVSRNHAKLKLALGDAWLCLNGRYVPRCRERGKRFAACVLPEELEILHVWHAEAVEYKFRPVVEERAPDQIDSESAALGLLWLKVFLSSESARLGVSPLSLDRYLDLPRVFPDHSICRNLALALRDRLKRGSFLRPVTDYPRGALMRALPCLLAADEVRAKRFISDAGDRLADSYFRWWQHYC